MSRQPGIDDEEIHESRENHYLRGNYSGRERSPCYKSGGGRSDKTGAGNTAAIALVKKSPIVQSAYRFLLGQAARIEDAKLRKETLDALDDPCIHHRANLTEAQKDAIVATLTAQGLINPADGAAIVGGVKASIFPPVLDDSSACPKLPQAFYSAPGSTSVNGHHSYPGGLVVHESNNDVAGPSCPGIPPDLRSSWRQRTSDRSTGESRPLRGSRRKR
jgi:hypothetical protein